jgi:hypothetical protein
MLNLVVRIVTGGLKKLSTLFQFRPEFWSCPAALSIKWLILGIEYIMKKGAPFVETRSVTVTYFRRLNRLSGLCEIWCECCCAAGVS